MVRERDPKFYSELKQLNEDLIKFLKTTHEKSPYFDLCPTLNDYVRQFNELERQYPDKETNTYSTASSSIPTLSSNLNPSALPFVPQKQPQQHQQQQLPATTTTTASSTTLSFKSTSNNISFGTSANNNSSNNNNSNSNAASAPKLTPFAPLTSVSGVSTGGVPSFSFGTVLSSAAPVFSFSSSATTTTTSSAIGGVGTGTNFSSSINAAPNLGDNSSSTMASPFGSSTRPPFLFGTQTNTQVTTSSTSGTAPTPLFSFSMAKKEEDIAKQNNASGEANDGNPVDNDDDAPSSPQIDKFEEPDAKYSVRCKFYEKSKKTTGELTLLGFGMLFVKSMDTKTKLQVIVRQEPDLRRLLLNEVITPSIPLKYMTKAVQMLFPGLGGENKIYLAKVKDDKDAQQLFELLNSVKNVPS